MNDSAAWPSPRKEPPKYQSRNINLSIPKGAFHSGEVGTVCNLTPSLTPRGEIVGRTVADRRPLGLSVSMTIASMPGCASNYASRGTDRLARCSSLDSSLPERRSARVPNSFPERVTEILNN